MKSLLAILLGHLVAANLAMAQTPAPSPPAAERFVMTWVPPYAVEKSTARLHDSLAGVGPPDTLTHLALQFWMPTSEGGVRFATEAGRVGDEQVIALRDWAHAHDIKVLLCIYNGAKSWDWQLARTAFATYPQEFTTHLVSEMHRLGLDGVDVDLEGDGKFEADKDAYLRFITDLSTKVHAHSGQLTVDSFSNIWNAPNQGWWLDLFPLVDGLTTMGYEATGLAAKDWRAYAAQEAAAGPYIAKLMIGVPTSVDQWQGSPALDQLHWVRDHGRAGVSLWDAQLSSPVWRTREIWTALREIRGKTQPAGNVKDASR